MFLREWNRKQCIYLNISMNETSASNIGSQSATESAKQLQLLLHSLTHEDTRENYSRHQLVLQKWCRDYCEGFFVRDLYFVCEIFGVLRDRLRTHKQMFRPILSSVLSIASLPLFEAKANERLRSTSVEVIKRYFYELSLFWSYEVDGVPAEQAQNSEITKCFRCIVNGGLDPAILKADIADQKWQSDGFRVQVTDTIYLQTQLRESGVVAALVTHFLRSAELYEREFDKHSGYLAAVAAIQREKEKLMKKGAAPASVDMDSDDEPAPASVAETSGDEAMMSVGAPPSKDLLADFQELLGGMRNLIMELTVDTKTAALMAEKEVGDGLIRLLKIASDNSPRDPQVSFLIDTLWTCLDAYLGQAPAVGLSGNSNSTNPDEHITLAQLSAVPIMNFEFGIQILLNLFLMLMHQGYRLADKECRNEVLVCLSMLATFPAALPAFLSTGALNVLVTYTCVVEMGESPRVWPFYTQPIAKARNYNSIHDIDLQLKRSMWLTIADILANDDPEALLCVASSPLQDNLIGYLEFNSLESQAVGSPSRASSQNHENSAEPSPGRSRGHTNANQGDLQEGSITLGKDQQRQQIPGFHYLRQLPHNQLLELQVQAAAFLAECSPKMLGEFVRVGGPVRLLDITHIYSKSRVPEHKALVYQCLLLINRCLMLSKEVCDTMQDENAIETFLTQFEYSDEEDTRTLVARLISILCSKGNTICQAQLRDQNGIFLMIRVLAQYAEKRRSQVGRKAGLSLNAVNEPEDGAGGPTEEALGGTVSIMVIAILDCLSRAVVGNKKSEVVLAGNEGVDALLNLLEVSQMLQRVQVLRLLSDLLENRKMLSFLHAWRSPKTMRPAAQLIAHCWLDEEARLGVQREQGILNNINDPLQCHAWPIDTVSQEPGQSLSSEGSLTLGNKSLAVSRLSDAISKARMVNGLVPSQLREEVLQTDTRGTIACILALIGVIDAYNATPPGYVGPYGDNIMLNLDQDSSLLIAPNFAGSIDDGGAEVALQVDVNGELVGGISEAKSAEKEKGQFSPLGSPMQHPGVGVAPHNQSALMDGEAGFSASQVPTVIINNEPGLGPSDRQVVAIANQYAALREGEWWRSVHEDLQSAGVEPVEADLEKIQSRLKIAFDAAFTVQCEQMELHEHDIAAKKDVEDAFVGQIMAKKEQQIKTLYLKKKGKGGATANPHASRPY